MTDDMPWVNLTPEEIQELRNKKHELTEYGKQKLRELMNDGKLVFHTNGKEVFRFDDPYLGECQTPEMKLEVKEMREDERIKVIQTACGAICKYSDALKELAETEKVELRAELEAKKKENYQLVADACMVEYEQKYHRDVFPVDEYWVYMLSEYGATGEGNTVCLMMTQANARGDDFTEDNRYVPINSKQYRAVREFHKQFGTWYLNGLRFLSKEDFFTECAYYIPPVMMKLSNKSCFKEFHTQVHYNFS